MIDLEPVLIDDPTLAIPDGKSGTHSQHGPMITLILKLYARYTSLVTLRRRVKRMGGSLGVLIPRDFAEAMRVKEGSEVRLTLVGNQVVVEPVEGDVDDSAFRRAFAAVLRRHRRAFGLLAEYDRGGWQPPRR
jgi:antitoxin component of MazEF toxin-antitoxin module